MEWGEIIRRVREQKGLNQLADEIGVDKTTIIRWEKGGNIKTPLLKKIAAALGFRKLNANYTLYSFKHSGAIQLFLATKDAYLVQRQCRHTTLDQTNTYLKDLGLFTDFKALDKWKGF